MENIKEYQKELIDLQKANISGFHENKRRLFSISTEEFISLSKNGIDLNILYVLSLYNEGINILRENNSSKLMAWRISLIRKGYLLEDNSVTALGLALLNGDVVEGVKEVRAKIRQKKENLFEGFNAFWSLFPATDRVEGKFPMTRGLRTDKNKCQEIFNAIVAEGEYTGKQIVEAMHFDVENRKRNSLKTGKNSLTFLQNSATYLRQKSFEPFIGEKLEEERKPSTGIVDI